ncbi:MAG: FAD-dependent oxidoreductase, partial [Deltaproteobacteria bacterium]|nr:FAD-dependent oxidoreductase [Deltaproteobacteria bacterium]
MVCLENEVEMPASPWEVEEATEEGIKIMYRRGVKEFVVKNGKVSQIVLKTVARVFDENKRFSPTYYEDQLTPVDVDNVIVAIGQRPDVGFICGESSLDQIKVTRRGTIEVDPVTLETGRSGVFAGGDLVTGPWIAIGAVAAGKKAAESI